jgi:hypothetical protein
MVASQTKAVAMLDPSILGLAVMLDLSALSLVKV